jgi:hypothetical protein
MIADAPISVALRTQAAVIPVSVRGVDYPRMTTCACVLEHHRGSTD